MVDCVDPERAYISKVICREHCIVRGRHKLKDLNLLKGRKLEDIVIVDNAITSFSEQLDNGIYVPSFFGDPNDKELLQIMKFLKTVSKVGDVRPYVKKFAGITKLLEDYRQRRQE